MYLVIVFLIVVYWGGNEYSKVKKWLNKRGYKPMLQP